MSELLLLQNTMHDIEIFKSMTSIIYLINLLPLWDTKFDHRIDLRWEQIFLNQMSEYDWWLYSHASAFLCVATSQEQKPFPNCQIVYLCACLLWRPSVYIYEYIYIYTFPYTIFAAPQSCLFFTSSPLSIHIKRSIHFFSKMGFSSRKLVLLVVLFNFTLLSAWSFRDLEAMRLLGGGQWAKRNSLVLQSLQKGPVFCHGFSVYMLAEDAAMASISKDGYDKDQSS